MNGFSAVPLDSDSRQTTCVGELVSIVDFSVEKMSCDIWTYHTQTRDGSDSNEKTKDQREIREMLQHEIPWRYCWFSSTALKILAMGIAWDASRRVFQSFTLICTERYQFGWDTFVSTPIPENVINNINYYQFDGCLLQLRSKRQAWLYPSPCFQPSDFSSSTVPMCHWTESKIIDQEISLRLIDGHL